MLLVDRSIVWESSVKRQGRHSVDGGPAGKGRGFDVGWGKRTHTADHHSIGIVFRRRRTPTVAAEHQAKELRVTSRKGKVSLDALAR